MAKKDHRTPGMGDEVPSSGEGSGAHTSGPAPQAAGGTADAGSAAETGAAPGAGAENGEELTVDDILGQAQNSAAAVGDDTAAPTDEVSTANEYLEDLRRVNAEYANYRKRTEDNRVIEQQRATAAVIAPLLAVLDDLDRAATHGDLVEGTSFHTIATKLRATLERQGLETYGLVGDLFDPALHEAIAQVPVPGTTDHTVLDVIERGYRLGGVELRPAKVAVAVGADG
jgi:molecular chaperone GrpE